MSKKSQSSPNEDLQRIIESATRLGVELDEAEALQWMTAISAAQSSGDVVVDTRSGVFGHTVSMLDFSAEDLTYFRTLGNLVEFGDEPGVVETALSLSGSAAQSKIQSHPGDADYFERVNIIAETKEAACAILARIMRAKAMDTDQGDHYQLIEVKFGNYPQDMVHDGEAVKAGAPISWKPAQVRAGEIEGFTEDGSRVLVKWDEVASDPGWCKLDWIVADPVRKKLSNASNMLDVTWQAPDGSIVPLDGYLDPYFQEVYLDAESIPLFSKLVKHVSSDALDEYVRQLEKEINKYLTRDINYGKAAKRMYNIFRLTGRYGEAVFVRELFDEPATMLYQVWSLVRTLDDCVRDETCIDDEMLLSQSDHLILAVIEVLDGVEEAEIVRLLLRVRDLLLQKQATEEWTRRVDAARAELINVVNNFFYDRLTAVPEIKSYMESFSS
jgi:hypothetical protein